MVTSWSLATTSQALRHADGMVSHVAGAIRQELTNDYDMQYLANFQVGGQAVWAIPDSGSQEVVCVTDKCGSCGDNSDGHLYSPSHSSSREECQASRQHRRWMTPVTDIKLGETAISCGAGTPCLAIFDIGTSLLAASGHIKTSLVQQLAFANCSSIDSIPSLHFKLAGMSFSLPPEAFMGNVVGGMVGDAEELVASGDCVPLFVEMTDEIDGQSLLILGLPFFRKFYTLFQQHPRSVMVAQANEDCTVRSGSWDLLDNEATKEHFLMSVNVTKLLPPRFRAKRDVRHGRQGSHE